MKRARKFNTVSKLKHSLDSAQSANARKFKARYKSTTEKFTKEVDMIIHLANLEMEDYKVKRTGVQAKKPRKSVFWEQKRERAK